MTTIILGYLERYVTKGVRNFFCVVTNLGADSLEILFLYSYRWARNPNRSHWITSAVQYRRADAVLTLDFLGMIHRIAQLSGFIKLLGKIFLRSYGPVIKTWEVHTV